MIFNLLINFVLLIFGAIFVFLPEVTLASIPYIGVYIDTVLRTIVGLWNSFLVTFPYAQTPWHVFLWVIIPFELLLIVARVFLGSRTPIKAN